MRGLLAVVLLVAAMGCGDEGGPTQAIGDGGGDAMCVEPVLNGACPANFSVGIACDGVAKNSCSGRACHDCLAKGQRIACAENAQNICVLDCSECR